MSNDDQGFDDGVLAAGLFGGNSFGERVTFRANERGIPLYEMVKQLAEGIEDKFLKDSELGYKIALGTRRNEELDGDDKVIYITIDRLEFLGLKTLNYAFQESLRLVESGVLNEDALSLLAAQRIVDAAGHLLWTLVSVDVGQETEMQKEHKTVIVTREGSDSDKDASQKSSE